MDVLRKDTDVRVDWLVGLEVERDLLLLPFISKNSADEKYKTVWWDTVVKFETLLRRSNRSQYGKTIDSGLDVGCSTIFLRQHCRDSGDLIL